MEEEATCSYGGGTVGFTPTSASSRPGHQPLLLDSLILYMSALIDAFAAYSCEASGTLVLVTGVEATLERHGAGSRGGLRQSAPCC